MARQTVFLSGLVFFILTAVPAGAQENRSIALILDASGSMNAKLASGGSRIDAAKAAVSAFVEKLDPKIRLGYRAYGHQSPTKQHNCKDTELLVGFGPAGNNRAAVIEKTKGVKAQGYTPITYVITLAAEDVRKEPGEHVVVLVSDGKETCEGDPCAAAKALAAADAKLVVHTIGFNVDVAARYQLQCIAKAARGSYSDASAAADLGAKLGELAAAKQEPPQPPQSRTAITVQQPKEGTLQIKNADSAGGHKVTEAESGKEVASMSAFKWSIELPAGLYNVTFGPSVWKSVEVKGGETTVLDPGTIEVKNAAAAGHRVLDWETGTEVGKISSFKRRLTVLPSTFTVMFGSAEWANVEVKAGENKVLNPAVIAVKGGQVKRHKVQTEDGKTVATLSGFTSTLPVPPGKYTIEVGNQKVPLDLVEGQRMEIDVP
ncbi:MAG TPA: VWA domain-containing protein [Pseudolabrys sp.]|nr:VWA domain-containing protein [Pseudolabrys sp.]